MSMRNSSSTSEALFVWRSSALFDPDNVPKLYRPYVEYSHCPFCNTRYRKTYYSPWGYRYREKPLLHPLYDGLAPQNVIQHLSKYSCTLCGFVLENEVLGTTIGKHASVGFLVLAKLDINDSRLGLDELGTHLSRRFSDAFALSPRRFEELVADIYRNLGYHSRLTQQTRDGGYDIVLLERATNRQVIVECKRYKEGRRVGVAAVREVLGVQLDLGVPHAKIVTTSEFTQPAIKMSEKLKQRQCGYELDLVDAARLVETLRVYNSKLPPLHADKRFSRGY
jgi:HJR/Mrr/RecB family endonuclease